MYGKTPFERLASPHQLLADLCRPTGSRALAMEVGATCGCASPAVNDSPVLRGTGLCRWDDEHCRESADRLCTARSISPYAV
jgi:hypothetical protein